MSSEWIQFWCIFGPIAAFLTWVLLNYKPPPPQCPDCGGEWTRVNDGKPHMANGWFIVCAKCHPEHL